MKTNSSPSLEKIITAREIQLKVRELADQISLDYAGKKLHLVGVLKGAFIFLADLVRFLTIPVQVHFLHASSYTHTQSSGNVHLAHQLKLTGKDILVIEDIQDTGLTLSRILEDLVQQKPASLEVCTLLEKDRPHTKVINIRYTGFKIPNEFVVGYGLDMSERFRELPYIARLS